VKILTETDAAYIAGFLDGDGSIHVRLKPNKAYRFGFQIAPNIVFYQSEKGKNVLERLMEKVGGGRMRLRNDGIVEYIIGDSATMKALINRIKPYLILKKNQADLLISILKRKESVTTKGDFLEVVRLIDSYKELNYSKKRKNDFDLVSEKLKNFTKKV
jgi:hypothetical protein